MMTKLTKLQTALIEQATTRADCALLPAPESVSVTDAALTRALAGLVKNGLATQSMVPDAGGEGPAYHLTEAGRTASGAEAGCSVGEAEAAATPEPARPGGKLGAVLKAIGRKRGATLAELAEATGWQPHTTRSALTRLRQRCFPAALTEEGIVRARDRVLNSKTWALPAQRICGGAGRRGGAARRRRPSRHGCCAPPSPGTSRRRLRAANRTRFGASGMR